MPKGSPELTEKRKNEILDACEKIYKTQGFYGVNIKEISTEISLTRPSIYNYFETKEEIFLALLQQEYERWVSELDSIMTGLESMTRDQLAQALARSVEHRKLLLKLMSMNHYDMEDNSRLERLVEFKQAYGNSIKAVDRLLQKFCGEMTPQERQEFLYEFFPFMYGVYPYTMVSNKQQQAMQQANVGFVYLSIYQMTYTCVKKLLGI